MFLHRLPAFAALGSHGIHRLLERAERRSVPAGGAILRQGEPADEVFVLMRGRVRVSRVTDGVERELAVLSEGRLFGELAPLRRVLRTATVTAIDASDVVAIPAAALSEAVSAQLRFGVFVGVQADEREHARSVRGRGGR